MPSEKVKIVSSFNTSFKCLRYVLSHSLELYTNSFLDKFTRAKILKISKLSFPNGLLFAFFVVQTFASHSMRIA